MALPDTVLRGTFANLPEDLLSDFMEAVAGERAAPPADPECLRRCGIESLSNS